MAARGGRGIVTLTTDFGTTGYHVGALKGALLAVNPALTIVDLCHGIGAGDLAEGAWTLLWNWKLFPSGTVHLAVIDPGVGTSRRALAAAAGGHFFVGPDNGLLLPAVSAAGDAGMHAIPVPAGGVSATFHGRDVFAPAAARLSLGVPLPKIGPLLERPVNLDLPRPQTVPGSSIAGEVVSVDPFGNLVANITAADLESAGLGSDVVIRLPKAAIRGTGRCYGDVAAGETVALVNSSGHLEIAVRGGRADNALGAAVGHTVTVRPTGGE